MSIDICTNDQTCIDLATSAGVGDTSKTCCFASKIVEVLPNPTQKQQENTAAAKAMGFNVEQGDVTRYCVADYTSVHHDKAKYSDIVKTDSDYGMKLQMYCDSAMKLAAAGLAVASTIISFN